LVSSFCVCSTAHAHSCSCVSLFRRRDEVSTLREEDEDEELQKDYEVLLQLKAADKPFYLSNVFMPIDETETDLQNIELLSKDITERPTFRCKWANCEQSFLSVEHLGLHLKNCHVKAQKDRENSLKKGFTCEWQGCSSDKRYRDSCNLMIHLRYKHTSERPYACSEPGCDKRFVQEHHMKKHAKAIHLPSAKNITVTEEVNQSEIYAQEIPDLIMEEVRAAPVSSALKKKRKMSETIEDLQTIAPEKLQERSYSEAPFQCRWKNCNATFSDMEAQANHISDAHIKVQKLLNRKEKKRGFACEWSSCTREKPFNSCYNLEHHIRYKHTGEKPYACSVTGCFSRFAQASDLREHLRLHSNPIHPEDSCKRMRISPEDELTERFLQNAQGDSAFHLPPISRLLLPLDTSKVVN